MGEIVLQGLCVVFVGVAVSAAVGAGIVISQSPAFHTSTAQAVTFVRRLLEFNPQGLREYLRSHTAAAVDAELFVIRAGGAGLEIQTVLPGNGTHPFGKG